MAKWGEGGGCLPLPRHQIACLAKGLAWCKGRKRAWPAERERERDMMLQIPVPQMYASPFPSEWTAEENALAIDVGVQAVKRTRPSSTSIDASKRELEGTLRRLISDRRPLEDKIATLSAELLSARALHDADLSTARAKAREEAHGQVKGLEERARRAEEDLRAERRSQRQIVDMQEAEARERSAQSRRENERFAAMVTQAEKKIESLEAELREKQDALAKMSVSANKGNAVEQELTVALRDTGLFTVDTSKGAFNTQYHDVLVAARPLHEVPDTTAVPRFESDERAPRCSLESKAHSRSGGIGAEREKFSLVRRRLMEGGRAECFVFAAKAAIPGQLRWHFEFVRVGGRHCVTGYVGAPDVGASEVCVMVQLVLQLQAKLDREVMVSNVPSDATLADLVEHATESLHTLREQIVRCDGMEKIVLSLREETKAMRAVAVQSLMKQVSVLTDNGFAPHDDTLADVREAHASLSVDARLSNCKILRNKEQFVAAKAAAASSSSSSSSSRKRGRECDDHGRV